MTVELDTLGREIEDVKRTVGMESPPFSGRTLWQLVDELYDTIPSLVVQPPPSVGICVLPDDATLIQDIRNRFRTELNRGPSDVELQEFLGEYRSATEAA